MHVAMISEIMNLFMVATPREYLCSDHSCSHGLLADPVSSSMEPGKGNEPDDRRQRDQDGFG